MKKYLKVLICVVALVSLTACSIKINIPKKTNDEATTKQGETTLPLTVAVTFPEGFTVMQIAERLEENKVCSKNAFLELCKRPLEGFNLPNVSDRIFPAEGYLFPDTYEFYTNTTPEQVFQKFIENYKSKITPELEQKAKQLGYTMDEMLTLASMIQKECDEDIEECATVSSVFHNRLKQSAYFPFLGSDVTSFYITKTMGEYLGYQEDVKLKNQNADVQKYMGLYSTYYCKGLPVGPICNPGMKAITAALNPADTDYLYFLTDPSGKTFYYAKTESEHNANGRKAGLF